MCALTAKMSRFPLWFGAAILFAAAWAASASLSDLSSPEVQRQSINHLGNFTSYSGALLLVSQVSLINFGILVYLFLQDYSL